MRGGVFRRRPLSRSSRAGSTATPARPGGRPSGRRGPCARRADHRSPGGARRGRVGPTAPPGAVAAQCRLRRATRDLALRGHRGLEARAPRRGDRRGFPDHGGEAPRFERGRMIRAGHRPIQGQVLLDQVGAGRGRGEDLDPGVWSDQPPGPRTRAAGLDRPEVGVLRERGVARDAVEQRRAGGRRPPGRRRRRRRPRSCRPCPSTPAAAGPGARAAQGTACW